MTTAELAALIGTTRLLRIDSQDREESIWVPVTVIDAKTSFGRVRLVVEPVNGSGMMNVNLDRTKEFSGN